MKNSNKINCDVENCNYNNSKKNICNLNSIKITSTSNNNLSLDKSETLCKSFENSYSPINDNIYEVTSETNNKYK